MTNDFERLQREREMDYEDQQWKALNRRQCGMSPTELLIESLCWIMSLLAVLGGMAAFWLAFNWIESFWRIKP